MVVILVSLNLCSLLCRLALAVSGNYNANILAITYLFGGGRVGASGSGTLDAPSKI